jgi:predicted SnoaL-like aldol condensation-catalyzing enzyme
MKPLSTLLICFCFYNYSTVAGAAVGRNLKLERNKTVVTSFYALAFNAHQPKQAVRKYVGEKYTQHNPLVADGSEAFIDFSVHFQKKHPRAHVEIKRVLAEGELVVLHVHSVLDDNDLGRAVIDIFRLENGKIVEHWDVGQPLVEKSANGNTMF